MKMIPRWLAIGEFIIAAFVLLSLLSVIVYAPFWLLGGISKKRRRPAERSMRLWPLIAVVSLLIVVAVVTVSGDDFIERMGNFTGWSFMVFLATLAFAISSIASVLAVWRSRKEGVRPAVKRFSLIVSLALLMATSYLAYYGIIGLRTWA